VASVVPSYSTYRQRRDQIIEYKHTYIHNTSSATFSQAVISMRPSLTLFASRLNEKKPDIAYDWREKERNDI
jgi:hypothetical protein